jgi:type II secretory pathway component GspD/PulD (secretin)
MLGGQRLVGEIEIESGVPVLSKIPLVNRLFTNRTKIKDERTLLILIKPTIIIQSEEENQLFPGLEANPEQYNIGNRLR